MFAIFCSVLEGQSEQILNVTGTISARVQAALEAGLPWIARTTAEEATHMPNPLTGRRQPPFTPPVTPLCKGVSEKRFLSLLECVPCVLILFILLFYQIQSGCLSVLASFICGKGKYSDKMESKAITGKTHTNIFPALKIFHH